VKLNSAFVFTRNGGGWSKQAKLVPSISLLNINSVAVSGDTAVLAGSEKISEHGGAYGDAQYGVVVYVFVRGGTTWSEQAVLRPSRALKGNLSPLPDIAIDGNRIIVGLRDDTLTPLADIFTDLDAYIFTREGGIWREQAKLVRYWGGSASGNYSISVDISKDTAVVSTVSAPDPHLGIGGNFGRAFIFTNSGSTWDLQATLDLGVDGEPNQFGSSVAISGDTLVVGNPRDGRGGNGSGAAYVYFRSGNVWSQQSKLEASDAAAGDFFGEHVDVSGEIVTVSSRLGYAYVFTRDGAIWKERSKLAASDSTSRFGRSVVVSDGTAIVNPGYIFNLKCSVTYSLPSNQWRQIGLPCHPGTKNTVTSVFGDDISGVYGTDWILYGHDGNGYIALTETDTLSQGIGYWIIQINASDAVLDMPANSTPTAVSHPKGCLSSAKGCVGMSLNTDPRETKWTMVGYPFASSGALRDARVVIDATALSDPGSCTSGCDLDTANAQHIVHNQLWTYNGSAYTTLDTGSGLEPWTGYWLATPGLRRDADNPRLLITRP
jgi:hypothetical protein